MTIYRMYVENGNRAGFWVQHRSWKNACALIVAVAGQPFGPLEGAAPDYGNPHVDVRWFDIRSGRAVTPPTDTDQALQLGSPGDINFHFIAEPAWSRSVLARESSLALLCPADV
jgi:hypothetical protein